MNVPICRAKKIDNDEYVTGYYQTETGINVEDKNNMFPTLRHIIVDLDRHQLRLDLFGDGKLHDDSHVREQYEIDPTTLAIHFPDMLDSQGNKIFASLNVKGGSLLEYEGTIYEVMYLNYLIQGVTNMHSIKSELFEYTKLIGIQQ